MNINYIRNTQEVGVSFYRLEMFINPSRLLALGSVSLWANQPNSWVVQPTAPCAHPCS